VAGRRSRSPGERAPCPGARTDGPVLFGDLPGWIAEPEVSFSIYGERGVIDILAWYPTRRILLVVELKTEIVDISEFMATPGSQAPARGGRGSFSGWDPVAIATWVVVADSRTNRRAVAAHATTLRSKLPVDGRGILAWLRHPSGPVDALGFLPQVHGAHLGIDPAPRRRVCHRRRARARSRPSVDAA